MAALPYIQLYIADYLADTAHLTTIQHGAYLLLIFNYWQRGHALNNTNGRLASVVRMSNEEWEQHEQTLAEFFEVDGDEWRNHRIDEDLAAVEAKSTKASLAGKASGATRRANAKRKPNVRSTNVERTPNHTDTDTDTENKNKDADASPSVGSLLANISPQVVADFKAIRRAKKSALTVTAVEGIQREAAKAGMTLEAALAMCCERGWQGFKAEWVTGNGSTTTPQPAKRRKQLGEGSSTNYGLPS